MISNLYKRTLSIVLLIAISVTFIIGVQGARLLYTRTAIPIPYFQQAYAGNNDTISHQKWQTILDNYIVNDASQHTYFNYDGVSEAHEELLTEYLDEMQEIDPTHYSKDEQFAYWVNLYNAVTISLVVDEYPVDSIKEIGSQVNLGPWDDIVVDVGGESLSLNNIEHGILRPIFSDNRVHYAVNCASLGCPNLSQTAFTAQNKEQQLQAAAMQFVNSEKGAAFIDGKLVSVSYTHLTLPTIYSV